MKFNSTMILSIGLLTTLISGCSTLGLRNDTFLAPYRLGEMKEWRNNPVVADVNKDGYPDILATHRRPLSENSLYIWLGSKSGELKSLTQTWASPGYSGLAVGDINGDSRPDIIAGSHFHRIHTFLALEDGSFKSIVTPTTDGYVAAEIVDLNRDSVPEIVLLGNERAGVQIYHWSDEHGLTLDTSALAGEIGRDLQIADINRDSRPDIVVSMARSGVVVLFQREDGGWRAEPANFKSETGGFKSLAVADLNADGWPDIAVNGGWSGVALPNGPDVYISNGSQGGWRPSSLGLKVFKKPAEGIAIGDFNQDGKLDLVAGGSMSNTIRGESMGLFMFSPDEHGNWQLVKNSGLPSSGLVRPYGLVARDINGDGLDDLVATQSDPEGDGGYVSVWPASGRSKLRGKTF